MKQTTQIKIVKDRFNEIVSKLDQMEAETVELDQIDQLLSMLDELEEILK